MRQKTILQGIGALAVALVLMMGLAGAAYAQAGDVIQEPGVLVTGVVAESPAAAAGLVRGDIILAVDGVPVNNAQELAGAVQAKDSGETLELTVRHGDEESTIPVAVTARDDGRSFLGVRPYSEDATMPAMPMEITPLETISGTEPVTLTLEEREVTQPAGAVVVAVLPGSPAEAAGIQPGDLIVAVDGITVTGASELVAAVAGYAPDDQVVLDVQHVGELDTQPVAVILAGRPDDDDQAYLGVSIAPATEADMSDDQDEYGDQGEPDQWKEPDDELQCPMPDGYPHHGQRGWYGPMMPHRGHPRGHMGWNGPMMPYGQGPHGPLRMPYHGQGYGWQR